MNIPWMGKGYPLRTTFAFLLLAQFVMSCATQPVAKSYLPDRNEEKWAQMSEEVQKQKNEITKLNEELRQLRQGTQPKTGIKVSARHLKGAPKLMSPQPKMRASEDEPLPNPVQKLSSFPAQDDAFLEKPIGFEEDSIADSAQESMHLYLEGLSLLEEKKYEEALENLRRFVVENPSHPYADRAQFLIGDTHYKTKEYTLVIVATNLLEARYPYSFRLPEALYERAMAYVSMNQMSQAKTALQNLVSRYPRDPFAENATKQLVQLLPEAAHKAAPPLLPEAN